MQMKYICGKRVSFGLLQTLTAPDFYFGPLWMLSQPQSCTDVAWLLMGPELSCEQALSKSLEISTSYFLFLGCSLHADWHCIDSLLQEWSLENGLLLLACWSISILCCSSYSPPNTSSSREVARKFEHSYGFFVLMLLSPADQFSFRYTVAPDGLDLASELKLLPITSVHQYLHQ